jgi:hypothetical protein
MPKACVPPQELVKSKKVPFLHRDTAATFILDDYEHVGFKLKRELAQGVQRSLSKSEQNLIIQFKFPQNLQDMIMTAWTEYKRAYQDYETTYRIYEQWHEKHENALKAKMATKESIPPLSVDACGAGRRAPPPPSAIRGGPPPPPGPMRGGVCVRGGISNNGALKDEHQIICALSLASTQLDQKSLAERESYSSLCRILFDTFQEEDQYSHETLEQAMNKYLCDVEKLKDLPQTKPTMALASLSRQSLERPTKQQPPPIEKSVREVTQAQKEVVSCEKSLKIACEKGGLSEVWKYQESLKIAFHEWKSKIEHLKQVIEKSHAQQLLEIKKMRQRLTNSASGQPVIPKGFVQAAPAPSPAVSSRDLEDLQAKISELERQCVASQATNQKELNALYAHYEKEWNRLKVYVGFNSDTYA